MNNTQSEQAQLRSTGGETATLQSVQIEGRMDGLLLNLKTRQHYRNDTKSNLETVYTFPLPWGATLLGLNAEIDGHRLQGSVLEKREATERYEKAIDDGDTPIMVEQSARGLYTANLGNLKPGEAAIIEIEYAQLLRFEQGQVRITVPTTVAPRYGDAHKGGGLAAHESVDSDPLVEYPLTLQITLAGQAARASVQCPTHAVALASKEDALLVTLKPGALLDRDFVLLLQGLQGQSFATVTPDGENFSVLASFCPELPKAESEPLMLKILVDCSGSMAGDSIDAARRSLHEVLKELTPQDWIGYSRFGSSVTHELGSVRPCNAATVREVARLIATTDADMGGTEMNAALLSTFALDAQRGWKDLFTGAQRGVPQQDVLLITDGDIWSVEEVIRSARDSGHRVFAVGVGSAPAESLLRELAEKTGGACELVSPTQDVAEVILRMFRRLRAVRSCELSIDWGQKPIWQSELPRSLFGGDTVHLFARLATALQAAPVLSWANGSDRAKAAAEQLDTGTGDTLARMGAATQLTQMPRHLSQDAPIDLPRVLTKHLEQQRLELALRYQLLTDQTNLLLVHVRADGSKAVGLPELSSVVHMQAAGWGGSGALRKMASARASVSSFSVLRSCASPVNAVMDYGTPSVWRSRRVLASLASSGSDIDDDLAFDSPVFLRSENIGGPAARECTPRDLLESFDQIVRDSVSGTPFDARLDALRVPPELSALVDELTQQLGSRAQAWGVVLQWIADALRGDYDLSRRSARVLRHTNKSLEAATVARAVQRLTEGMATVAAWAIAGVVG